MIVGATYEHRQPVPNLKGTLHDAVRMQMILRHVFGFSDIRSLLGSMATRDGIMKALNAVAEESGVVVVYMSGHGTHWRDEVKKKQDEGFLASDIAFKTNKDAEFREGSEAITGETLRGVLEEMVQRAAVTLLFDTCYSGSLYRITDKPRGVCKNGNHDNGPIIYKLPNETGGGWVPNSNDRFVHIGASSHLHPALELFAHEADGIPSGAFTFAFERVLKRLLDRGGRAGISSLLLSALSPPLFLARSHSLPPSSLSLFSYSCKYRTERRRNRNRTRNGKGKGKRKAAKRWRGHYLLHAFQLGTARDGLFRMGNPPH